MRLIEVAINRILAKLGRYGKMKKVTLLLLILSLVVGINTGHAQNPKIECTLETDFQSRAQQETNPSYTCKCRCREGCSGDFVKGPGNQGEFWYFPDNAGTQEECNDLKNTPCPGLKYPNASLVECWRVLWK